MSAPEGSSNKKVDAFARKAIESPQSITNPLTPFLAAGGPLKPEQLFQMDQYTLHPISMTMAQDQGRFRPLEGMPSNPEPYTRKQDGSNKSIVPDFSFENSIWDWKVPWSNVVLNCQTI